MNGVHDIAGMDNLGPLIIEKDEPVFHEDWERVICSLTMSMLVNGYFKTDEVRRTIEMIPPADYLKASYYEKWLCGMERILVEKDVLTPEEIASGASTRRQGGKILPAVPLETLQYVMTNPVPVNLDLDMPQKFKVGDRIVAKNINPTCHTRLPRYIRGRRGVIEQHHGIFLLPDSIAHDGPEKPQHLYNVRFTSAELWGDENPSNDFVYIDLFDDYMEMDI